MSLRIEVAVTYFDGMKETKIGHAAIILPPHDRFIGDEITVIEPCTQPALYHLQADSPARIHSRTEGFSGLAHQRARLHFARSLRPTDRVQTVLADDS